MIESQRRARRGTERREFGMRAEAAEGVAGRTFAIVDGAEVEVAAAMLDMTLRAVERAGVVRGPGIARAEQHMGRQLQPIRAHRIVTTFAAQVGHAGGRRVALRASQIDAGMRGSHVAW